MKLNKNFEGIITGDKTGDDGYADLNTQENLVIRNYDVYTKQQVEIQIEDKKVCVDPCVLIAYLNAVVDSKKNNKF